MDQELLFFLKVHQIRRKDLHLLNILNKFGLCRVESEHKRVELSRRFDLDETSLVVGRNGWKSNREYSIKNHTGLSRFRVNSIIGVSWI